MLNSIKLSELLTRNVDPQLYPRMFVMSSNGALLAYSTPVDIKDLRDQAALVSMTWREQEANLQSRSSRGTPRTEQSDSSTESSGSSAKPRLETLTIEFQHNNIIIRAIQPKLLLVLVGSVPPTRSTSFKITTEAYGDSRYPAVDLDGNAKGPSTPGEEPPSSSPEAEDTASPKGKATSIAESHMSQLEKDLKIGALHIQRKKLDNMTRFIRSDFDSKGFVMPEDPNFP